MQFRKATTSIVMSLRVKKSVNTLMPLTSQFNEARRGEEVVSAVSGKRQTDRQTGRERETHTHRQTDRRRWRGKRERERETDRQIDRRAERERERERGRERERAEWRVIETEEMRKKERKEIWMQIRKLRKVDEKMDGGKVVK